MKTNLRTDITIEQLCEGFVYNEYEEVSKGNISRYMSAHRHDSDITEIKKTNQIQKKSGQSKTWTLTMFQHGAKAEKQILKIVRCFVKLIIAQKETNKKQWIRFSHWIIF